MAEHINNILIIDDQLANLQILAAILKQNNYKVRKAIDAESALEAMQTEPPNLVLLDIRMPKVNGYEVCKWLKSQPHLQHIPVIFMSALQELEDKIQAFEVGGVDYITKPFQEQEVLVRVRSQLTIHRQQILLEQEQERLRQEQAQLQEEIQRRQALATSLAQSQALLESILTTSQDGIVALEAIRDLDSMAIVDFCCSLANPMVARLLNCQMETLLGSPIGQHLSSQLDRGQPSLLKSLAQVVETGQSLERDVQIEASDLNHLEQRWYNLTATKLGDGLSLNIRDITHRKNLELRLNHLANRDGLTDCHNRYAFDKYLQKCWQTCSQRSHPITLILLDVDYFKFYNDYYGHQMGDRCLIEVVRTVANVLNPATDFLARYGGEEFVLILAPGDAQRAVSLVQKIQAALVRIAIPHDRSPVKPIVSVSFGIASTVPTPNQAPQSLLHRADQALYQAKAAGRDRWVVDSACLPNLLN
jgi:two-component system, cell cycle response regulator